MKIACIGGGPAGLYLGILVKRVAPQHEVVIYERNRPTETFGFGVVFSDATLGNLAAADPETHAQIAARFARWDDIEVHFKGETLTSTGHGFCGLERQALLGILQTRASALDVKLEYEREINTLAEVRADLIVASEGVASWVREALAPALSPQVDVRPNKFVWLGCTVPYRAFTFLFADTPHGMFRVHAYPFKAGASTFIVECREPTWRASGLAEADEDRTVAILGDIFRDHLGDHHLIKNRSIWRSFPTVRCASWSASSHGTPVVLLGDAAHTAHFSIGSGTKLAMEDSIVLRDELLATSDVPSALVAYEAKRRPEVEALQAAAQASLEWFEGTERYTQMSPVQFTYSLMTRSLRVSHASVAKRDPHLARGVEQLLAAKVGVTREPPLPPTALPFAFGTGSPRTRAPNRIAIACKATHAGEIANDDDLVAMGSVAATAGLVVTPAIAVYTAAAPGAAAARWSGPRINSDEQAVAWRRIVDFVHAKGAVIVARIATSGAVSGAPSGALSGALEAAVQRAAFAGFDLLLLDPGADSATRELAFEHLPGMIQAARTAWPATRAIAAWIHDRPSTRASVVGSAAQLVRAGATQLWISSSGDTHLAGARLPAAPTADRLRNELGVTTAVVVESAAALPDLDAAIAAGRADLVVTSQPPSGFARRT